MSDNEVNLDLRRVERIGLEEAILCMGKSTAQLRLILARVRENGGGCLLTRLPATRYAALDASDRALMDYEESSKTAYFDVTPEFPAEPAIAILTAGSSDVAVAREALRTLNYFGVNALPVFDVGIAGLWRLLDRIDELRRFPLLIVVAGMDAALPSVLGGLYPGVIIAVPSSVGYGVAAGGQTALNAILASCAPGIVTVNIDNGYGAACAALRMLRLRSADGVSADRTAGSARRN